MPSEWWSYQEIKISHTSRGACKCVEAEGIQVAGRENRGDEVCAATVDEAKNEQVERRQERQDLQLDFRRKGSQRDIVNPLHESRDESSENDLPT